MAEGRPRGRKSMEEGRALIDPSSCSSDALPGRPWRKEDLGGRKTLDEGRAWRREEHGGREAMEEGRAWRKGCHRGRKTLDEGRAWMKECMDKGEHG